MIAELLLAAAIDSVFFANPVVTGHLGPGLEEASGMVASKQYPGLLWTHNDSGDGPVIYGIDSTGRRRCAYEFTSDDTAHDDADWEDIAYGWHVSATDTTYHVYVGDIGDNNARREFISIYTMHEGSNLNCVPSATLAPPRPISASRRNFVYPDGPRDAETLLFDPMTEDLYIISKREKRNRLYRVPRVRSTVQAEASPTLDTLQFLIELPFFAATGGDISRDGREILIRTYTHVYRWTRGAGESLETALSLNPVTVNYMPEPQGEAICFNASGAGFYTLSETGSGGEPTPLYYYARTRNVPQQSLKVRRNMKRLHEYIIQYKLGKRTPVILSVHNELMMTVKSLVDEEQKPGAHKSTIDMSAAAPGTYVVVLRYDAHYSAVPFTVSASTTPEQTPVATSKRKRKIPTQK